MDVRRILAEGWRVGTGAPEARTLAVVLVLLTIWRLGTSGLVGLGDAEAYDWVWSQFPSASYFDHPPVIAWLVGATTAVAGDTPFGVRLGPILLFPVTVAVLFVLGRDLFGARAALLGCLALIATPAFHIGGVSASPDTPLGFFWALSLLALWRAVARRQAAWMYVLGGAAGLAFLSKYFAVLLAPVAVLVLLRREHRHWWRRPEPWLALGLAALCTLPVLIWNEQNAFASFRYHLILRQQAAGVSWNNVGRLVFGQIGYVSPILLAGYLWTMGVSLQRRHDAAWAFVAAASIPVLVFFSLVTIWTPEAEPHWPVLAYLPACLGLGGLVDERRLERGEGARRVRRAFVWGLGLPAVLLAILYVHLLTPVFVPMVPARWYDPAVDLANELRGWPEVGVALRAELDGMPADTVVLAYHYTMCSQAAFAIGDAGRMRCLNTRLDALDFLGLGEVEPGADALYVRDNRYDLPAERVYAFARQEDAGEIAITRGGREVRRFTLTRLYGVVGLVPGVRGL